MKIALTTTKFFGLPPPSYGGLESVAHSLWKGLIERGHRVVAFSPDPTIVPEGGFHKSTGEAKGTVNVDWIGLEREAFSIYDKYLDEFDITTDHSWFGFPYLSKKRNPEVKVAHTHHGGLADNYWKRSPPPFKLNLIAISKWMQQVYQQQGFPSQVAYNMVDTDAYEFKAEKGGRLMFLGRIDPIKAPHMAVTVANKSNIPIDIVGGTSFVTDTQYIEQVRTMCAGEDNFVGEVDHDDKLRRLQDAKALLIPSQFGEPFGLIAIEAMACGTVPIALNDGALGEIIEHGKSGFVCNNHDEMVDAVSRIDTISAKDCRARAEFFSIERGAERYEQIYQTILDGQEW
jgi:glycosyltransferase involved in cell wall biosynthesis